MHIKTNKLVSGFVMYNNPM